MIRSYNQLVPYGSGEANNISTLLIGNIGRSDAGSTYLALYHEPKSDFSPEITKFKYIVGHDRRQSLFFLMRRVYDMWDWYDEEEIRKRVKNTDMVDVMLKRLEESKT